MCPPCENCFAECFCQFFSYHPSKVYTILLVHGTIMPAVSSDTYLGDIICGDGSNKLNIENRVLKGLGKVAQIMSMVDKISLGKHYFKIALLLRESILLSSILTNSEVWYRLTKTDLEELEILDRSLLKRIFAVPNSSPTAALYLETGCMRVGTIVNCLNPNSTNNSIELNLRLDYILTL